MLDVISSHDPHLVFIPEVPFNTNETGDQTVPTFYTPEELDAALMQRYRGKRRFKVGAVERAVYEKVGGMKRINAIQSILYNFSSEGAFGHLGLPLSCYGLSPQEGAVLLAKQASLKKQEPLDVVENVKAQVLLSKLFWISEVVKFEGCPKCKKDQLETGPEDVWMPYINTVSSKMIRKDLIEVEMANKIVNQIQMHHQVDTDDEDDSKKGSRK